MADQGVLMTTMTWGANLTETAMAIPVSTVRTIRDEVLRVTFAGVDWAEGVNQSAFKVLREMLKRVDRLSQEGVDGFDAVTGAISRVIRGSGGSPHLPDGRRMHLEWRPARFGATGASHL
jgi:hypothetical protein